jgi:hypothetical protein
MAQMAHEREIRSLAYPIELEEDAVLDLTVLPRGPQENLPGSHLIAEIDNSLTNILRLFALPYPHDPNHIPSQHNRL